MTPDDRHPPGVTVRVGLVGAGGVGARHARTLAGFDDVDLVGDLRPRGGVRRGAGRGGGRPRRPRPRPACSPLGLDAVWLCVPPFAHGELELVGRSGRAAVLRREAAGGRPAAWPSTWPRRSLPPALPTATGYHWRHLDTVGRARSALAGTAVRLVGARWWGTTPPPAWWSRQDRSGGQVVEQATHLLDLVRLLAGEVVEVVGAAAPSSADGRDVPDATVAVLRLGPAPSARSALLRAARADGRRAGGDRRRRRAGAHRDRLRRAHPGRRGARRAGGRTRGPPSTGPSSTCSPAGSASPGLVDVAEALRTHRLAWAVAEAARTGAAGPRRRPMTAASPGPHPRGAPGRGAGDRGDHAAAAPGRPVPGTDAVHRAVGRHRAHLVPRDQPVPPRRLGRRARHVRPRPARGAASRCSGWVTWRSPG